MFSCRLTNVSVQTTAIAVGDCTPIVHADCKRSKAHSSVSRNLSSPIPGRLVVKSKYQTPVSAPDKRTHPYDSRTRLCEKFRKIAARTYTKNPLSGLPFRFDTGKSLSNRKEVENSRKFCSAHGDRITNNPKVAYVPDRCTSIPKKDNTNGSVIYAPFPMVPKNKLAVSPVTRPEDSCFKSSEKASSVVERFKI